MRLLQVWAALWNKLINLERRYVDGIPCRNVARVNPKNFNDHDNYSTLRLEHSACNQKIYKDMNYNKLLNFRVPFYSFGFRGCFASFFWECCR